MVFAKIARPKRRADTLIFSKSAVICMRDGELCLLFRVGDMRRTQLAEAHIRLQMIKKRITAEGELLPFHQYDMDVGYDTGQDRIFVVWPICICHVIDENSPLYDVSAQDLEEARFEALPSSLFFLFLPSCPMAADHRHPGRRRSELRQLHPGQDLLPPLRGPLGPQVRPLECR